MFHGSFNGRESRDVKTDLPVKSKEVQDTWRHHHHVGGVHQVVGEGRLPELTGGGVPNANHLNAVP